MTETENETGTKPVRIPLAVAGLISRKKAGSLGELGQRVSAAKAVVERPGWGPELSLTAIEQETLLAYVSELKSDTTQPAKVTSAATKLISTLRDLTNPAPVKPHHNGHVNVVAASPDAAAELDRVMEQFTGSPAAAVERTPPAMPPLQTPPHDTILDNGTGLIDHRRAAILRLGTLHEIMRFERPGIASVILQILDSVKKIT